MSHSSDTVSGGVSYTEITFSSSHCVFLLIGILFSNIFRGLVTRLVIKANLLVCKDQAHDRLSDDCPRAQKENLSFFIPSFFERYNLHRRQNAEFVPISEMSKLASQWKKQAAVSKTEFTLWSGIRKHRSRIRPLYGLA